jgi:hypothetical protein
MNPNNTEVTTNGEGSQNRKPILSPRAGQNMQFINNFENMLNHTNGSELQGVVSPRKSNLYRNNNVNQNPGMNQYSTKQQQLITGGGS